MKKKDNRQWLELLQIDLDSCEADQIPSLVSRKVRNLCLDLNSREDRIGITFCIKRLKDVGGLFEKHSWLMDDQMSC